MFTVSQEQRRALLAHVASFDEPDLSDGRDAEVIDDLDAARPIADRDAFVAFLWLHHLAVARLRDGSDNLDTELRAWHASVDLLDQFGESLRGIFSADGAATA